MRTLLLICTLFLSGCVSSALPAWWTAHKVYLLEAGMAAGALTQIEQFGLTSEKVAQDVWKK